MFLLVPRTSAASYSWALQGRAVKSQFRPCRTSQHGIERRNEIMCPKDNCKCNPRDREAEAATTARNEMNHKTHETAEQASITTRKQIEIANSTKPQSRRRLQHENRRKKPTTAVRRNFTTDTGGLPTCLVSVAPLCLRMFSSFKSTAS